MLFIGALLSKTVTCSLPAVLLLIAWWERGTIDQRALRMLAPLFVVGVVMALVTIWMEQHRVGAVGNEWALSLLERCLVAGRALWFYPSNLLWPRQLIFIYPRWSIDVRAWWQYLFPAAAVVLLVVLYAARTRLGRGPLVAALCYAGALFPALGFINVYPMRYSFVADHFAYLPIIGVMVLTTAAGRAILERIAPADGRLVYAVGAATLLLLGILTARQCGVYRNLYVLWSDTLTKNPECWLAHNNLGAVLRTAVAIGNASPQPSSAAARGDQIEVAIRHFEQALRINPDSHEAHTNLGAALHDTGHLPEAIEHWQRAIQIKPDFADAHDNLAVALAESGRLPEAITHYEQAVRLNPSSAETHSNFCDALRRSGRLPEAIAHCEQALRLQADFTGALDNLGAALADSGRLPEAIEDWQRAVQINPDFTGAHNNLGLALADSGRLPEAIEHYEHSLRLEPNNPSVHHNLGIALARIGQLPQAIEQYEQALRLTPENAQTWANLALAYRSAGETAEAASAAHKALDLARSTGQSTLLATMQDRLRNLTAE